VTDKEDVTFILEMIKSVGDALGQAQARNRAYHYLLTEIVRLLAKQSDDPRAFLAQMFELISARADQAPLETEGDLVSAEFRRVIADFFISVGTNL
jgi:hypothetical protein